MYIDMPKTSTNCYRWIQILFRLDDLCQDGGLLLYVLSVRLKFKIDLVAIYLLNFYG